MSHILTQFPTSPCVDDGQMLENVRSALGRDLPRIKGCKPHTRVMSIAGGGPSLGDTWRDLSGVIVTANASLGFLLSKGVKPWACGLLDPRPHIADLIEPRDDVFFFVASCCHPRVFDKIGDRAIIWHPSGMPGLETELPTGTDMIGGGSTMGLRWLNLGYFMGFRSFDAHGLDSSFKGESTHAYPDHTDGERVLYHRGFATRLNFLQQVDDWFSTKAMFASLPDPPEIRLHGEGLLQTMDRECSTRSAATTKTISDADRSTSIDFGMPLAAT